MENQDERSAYATRAAESLAGKIQKAREDVEWRLGGFGFEIP